MSLGINNFVMVKSILRAFFKYFKSDFERKIRRLVFVSENFRQASILGLALKEFKENEEGSMRSLGSNLM
jgi:hypothetical protein